MHSWTRLASLSRPTTEKVPSRSTRSSSAERPWARHIWKASSTSACWVVILGAQPASRTSAATTAMRGERRLFTVAPAPHSSMQARRAPTPPPSLYEEVDVGYQEVDVGRPARSAGGRRLGAGVSPPEPAGA